MPICPNVIELELTPPIVVLFWVDFKLKGDFYQLEEGEVTGTDESSGPELSKTLEGGSANRRGGQRDDDVKVTLASSSK